MVKLYMLVRVAKLGCFNVFFLTFILTQFTIEIWCSWQYWKNNSDFYMILNFPCQTQSFFGNVLVWTISVNVMKFNDTNCRSSCTGYVYFPCVSLCGWFRRRQWVKLWRSRRQEKTEWRGSTTLPKPCQSISHTWQDTPSTWLLVSQWCLLVSCLHDQSVLLL